MLVLRGEAGVGKTALLEYVLRRAGGCRVVRAAGVESEMELAFAGLHLLCTPFLDRLDQLPAPQRDALGIAFGLRAGDAPDRFLVGLAVLTLLSDVAEERPLLCVVDDAQWLDRASAQALEFVARRLGNESVGIVFAVRKNGEHDMPGLDELIVEGLADSDARALLESVVTGRLDESVLERIVADTRGNPLALLELPRGLSPGELAGGFGLPDAAPLTGRIEESFRRRLAPLPGPTRLLLLVAAAEPVGDPVLVWRAAEELGIDALAAAPAVEAGLLTIDARVRFRHPLVRSAVYRAASPEQRRNVHRALAHTTDADNDPDRRAWHMAQATPGFDEDVAAELEHSAGRARTRGGLAAAAAFHERAAELTPDASQRARRALAAAQSKHQAGAPDAALQLLSMAEAGPLEELDRARAELLRAQITFAVTRGRDAPPQLLKAAKRLESLDASLARETYLDAFAAALSAGRLARGVHEREVAEAVLAADWGKTERESACDLLLDGLALLTTEGYRAGAPALKDALRAFREESMSEEAALRWLWLACRVAGALADDEAWDELTERQVRLARQAGALSLLPMALNERASLELVAGHLANATALVTEASAVIEATGSHLRPHATIWMAVWHGREDEANALIEAARQDVVRRGEGLWLRSTDWTTSVLYLALGRYEEAHAAAERAIEQPDEVGLSTWAGPELVEAAVRSGHPERAEEPMARLTEMCHACGTDWALGLEARSRALLCEGAEADALYEEAIVRLGRTRIPIALARARLLYGEWLRRESRRMDAREQLRSAHRMLTEMGAEGFAERARRELVATGETARKRSVETIDELTAQEAQIARMASDGHTNPEIGAQLFISPRTVEWHLRKVFTKLGISSRRQLRNALPGSPGSPGTPATC